MADSVDTVIVGAGASGLHVARQLCSRGLSVRVLEARERVGGRLLSPALAGARFDIGATWFWDGEWRIAALLEQLGLQRYPQHLAGSAMYDQPQGPQRLANNPLDVPAWRIVGGTQRLAEELAAGLPPGALHLGTPVQGIFHEQSGVRVVATGAEVVAANVVVALPPALAMSLLDFRPQLADAFTDLARHTPVWMGTMSKAVAVYPEAFWRTAGLAGSAFSLVGPMREVHDMSSVDGRPGALFGFVPFSGQTLRREHLVGQLERVFGERAGAPARLAVLDWRTEQYTSPPGVEALDDYELFGHRAFATPMWDGRLHFASTETSSEKPGHIEGALAAAERCVAAITGGGGHVGTLSAPGPE